MTIPLITLDELRRIIHYDPLTGVFHWAVPRPKIRVGDVAGTTIGKHNKNHVCIIIYGKKYKAHRLAWFYTHGIWPNGQIDHEDLDGMNNRLINLREATNGQNCANRRAFGASGLKGASLHRKSGKWHAQITYNKKCISIGYFDTAEEAHSAYVTTARRLHGEFARAA